MEADLLKKLCRSLDGQRKKSHQEAVEWQHFGRFTASVLQKEVEGFERKLRVLQERLDGLVRENGELRDMCLYLDKSRKKSGTGGGGGREARTGRGQFDGVPVHSMCVEEMNRDDTEPALQYSGITSEDTLRDKKVKQFNVLGTKGQLFSDCLHQHQTASLLFHCMHACRPTNCCDNATKTSGEAGV